MIGVLDPSRCVGCGAGAPLTRVEVQERHRTPLGQAVLCRACLGLVAPEPGLGSVVVVLLAEFAKLHRHAQ